MNKIYRITATNFFKHKAMLDGRIFWREISMSEVEVMAVCDFKYVSPILKSIEINN